MINQMISINQPCL